ncbi:MAG: immunoglobulin domain-containing protein [Deltaproteobacteria bacterium]|nr:immunoglobulin domain-containing protein [Deltaproteobacteria bacterium]
MDTNIVDVAKGVLSVTASSATAMRYQWYKNGLPIRGAIGRTLTVTGAAGNHNAYFYCIVRNAVGSITTPVVKVQVIPQALSVFTLQPVTTSVAINTIATFSVAASSNAPVAYQWYRNGVAIRGATRPTYSVKATALHNNSAYHCAATTRGGTAYSSVVRLYAS